MKEFKRYFSLYKIFVKQFLKTIMQSKVDFIIGIVGFLLTQVSGIAFLYLIFEQIPTLYDWSFNEMLFIYGFSQIPRGIDHIFTDNLWMLSWRYIITGQFDRYLLRPMNALFQVICEKIQIDGMGELLIGIILVYKSSKNSCMIWDFNKVVIFVVSIIAGTLIYSGIKLFFASLAFWFKDSLPFLQTAYRTSDFSKYPTQIYSKLIRSIITYVIPFAFVGYIPSRYFVKGGDVYSSIGAECFIAFILLVIALYTFNYGMSIYESSGN